MSVIQAVATATPSISPHVDVIVKAATASTIDPTSHLFQLAQIIKYVSLGAGLSLVHAVLNGKLGLPKWVNVVLPLVYAGLGGLAIAIVDNAINWNDWYQVFLQVLAGAAGLYALVTAYGAVSSPATPKTDLPVVAEP